MDWVDDRANKRCRKSEAMWLAGFEGQHVLKRRQVMALIEWQFGTQPEPRARALDGIDGPSGWGHARRCIKKALAASSPTEALDQLLDEMGGIPGWGPFVSSVVLVASRPDAYAIADPRALHTLNALHLYRPQSDGEFLRLDWWPYLVACRKLAKLSGLSLRVVGQALAVAAHEAPELPKRPARVRSSNHQGTTMSPARSA
jgi:hypothetical protein